MRNLMADRLLGYLSVNFQTGADTLPFRSAFKDVIFGKSQIFEIERPLAAIQPKLDEDGKS